MVDNKEIKSHWDFYDLMHALIKQVVAPNWEIAFDYGPLYELNEKGRHEKTDKYFLTCIYLNENKTCKNVETYKEKTYKDLARKFVEDETLLWYKE